MTQETSTKKAEIVPTYGNINPEFLIHNAHSEGTRAELSLLESKLQQLMEEVCFIPAPFGAIKPKTISVLFEDTEKGYKLQPKYGHSIQQVSTGTGSNAKVTLVQQDHAVIWIGNDAYRIYFKEQQKTEGM